MNFSSVEKTIGQQWWIIPYKTKKYRNFWIISRLDTELPLWEGCELERCFGGCWRANTSTGHCPLLWISLHWNCHMTQISKQRHRNKQTTDTLQVAEFIPSGIESNETKSCSQCLSSTWLKKWSLCTFIFLIHECCLVSAVGKACSWNCFVVSFGLITTWHLLLIGCEERSDWYLESTSVVIWSRWCYCGSGIKLQNLISWRSQSVEACGLTTDTLASESGEGAPVEAINHT